MVFSIRQVIGRGLVAVGLLLLLATVGAQEALALPFSELGRRPAIWRAAAASLAGLALLSAGRSRRHSNRPRR